MQPSVQHPVSQTIEKHLKRYLDDLGDTAPSNVYQMVLTVMEKPVLEPVSYTHLRAHET